MTEEKESMSIGIKTTGIHHLALWVKDFHASRSFYVDTLGFEVVSESGNDCLLLAGVTQLAIRGLEGDARTRDVLPRMGAGLDHIALACESETELERVARALSDAGVWNTGIMDDAAHGGTYVGFKDPDGIGFELYMA